MKFSVAVVIAVVLVSEMVQAVETRLGRTRALKGSKSDDSKALKDKKGTKAKKQKVVVKEEEPTEAKPATTTTSTDCPEPVIPAAGATAPKNCLTKDGVNAIMKAFEGAVVAISNAYWCRGDSANETECGTTVEEGPPPKAACDRAYKIAHGAIDGAYGYADSVLFKPTLTTEPYTYRPTRNGALSYFIGTVCVNLSGLESEQFPDGNGDGKMFQENGFALNAYKGSDGIQRTGWTDLEYDLEKFLYRIDPEGGQNCETAVVQGQMCFVHHNTELSNTCVDKTFGFNDLTGDGTSPVITTHHSSASIKEESSLVICQNEGGGKVPKCE